MLDKMPKTRAGCVNGPRPCPWLRCRYHMLQDLLPQIWRKPSRRPLGPDQLDPDDTDAAVDYLFKMPYTCVLDAVGPDSKTLEEVGQIFNITRERIRQLEARAVRRQRIIRILLGLVGRAFLEEELGAAELSRILRAVDNNRKPKAKAARRPSLVQTAAEP